MKPEQTPNWDLAARELYGIQQRVLRKMGQQAVTFYKAKAAQVGLNKTGNLRKQIKYRLTPLGLLITAGAKQSRIHNIGGTQPSKVVEVAAHTREGHTVPAHRRRRGDVKYRQRGFMYVRMDLVEQAERELLQELEQVLFR
jgi:hypothetical protein